MKAVCVFCGSNRGNEPQFEAGARSLGTLLARRGIRLVYGGGGIGLMGIVADAVLASGGEVFGVIPGPLASKEVAHQKVTRMFLVETMHERKSMMAELSDAFIAMPGGFGTFEELFEAVTWTQLGIHRKPVGLLNLAGYFDLLLAFLDQAVERGFVRRPYRSLIVDHGTPEGILDLLDHHQLPETRKWLDPSQT